MENKVQNELSKKIAEIEQQISDKAAEVSALKKEAERLKMIVSTDYDNYIGNYYKIEMIPCSYRYIHVTSVTINQDGLPVIHGTGFDKTVMLIKSSTSFSSSSTQWTILPDTVIKELDEEQYEKIKAEEIAKLSKL